MGSAAHIRSASTCSVTTIDPIFAAIPAPTLIACISAPTTAGRPTGSGARSRSSLAGTLSGDMEPESGPKPPPRPRLGLAIGSVEREGDEVIEDEDPRGRGDHGGVDAAADARRAALD